LHIARLLGIVVQYLADFADSAVNAVVGIEKGVLAPDLLGDFFAGDELTFLLDQYKQHLYRNALELKRATVLPEFEGSQIDLEVLTEPNGFLGTDPA
jgi:hypothetical protein